MTNPGHRSTRREASRGVLLATPRTPRTAPGRPLGSGSCPEPLLAAILGALLLLAGTGGCGAAPPPPPAPPADAPRVELPSGAVFALEVARTPEQIARGLMFRESLAPASGMVFLFESSEPRAFWMKNCHFALDMVFALADGTVVDVLAGVPPCAADPCPSYPSRAPADTVVELTAGEAARHGIVPGARLRFLSVPGR